MNRAAATIAFFRARLDDEEAHLARPHLGSPVPGLDVLDARVRANHDADRALLARYDYFQEMACPGNGHMFDLINEYEDFVFPIRINRFGDHPAWASLAANVWVERDYLDARDAGGSADAR